MDGWLWDAWLAYAAVEPFGPVRDDLRAAEVVSAVAASGGVRVKPADVFESLRESRPRGRDRGGLPETVAALAALCPALTPTTA